MERIIQKTCILLCLVSMIVSLFAMDTTACAEGLSFSKSDYNNVSEEAEDAMISLEGDRGTLSDPTRGRSGNPVVIERKGVYRVTGCSDGVTIQIREPKKSGNIYLVLDNVSMTNADGPCIESRAAEQTIIQCVGENSLLSLADKGAALYSEDDLTINGSGSLEIESRKNGIQCKSVLRITGSKLTVRAVNDGLKGKKGFLMDGGSVNVTGSYEGLEGGQIDIRGGELHVTASDDGLNAAGEDVLQGDVVISGGKVFIDAAGDAIDSNRSIFITGGTTLVEGPVNSRNSIFDKGDTADARLSISGGIVLAIGSAEKAKNFKDGTQYSRLEPVTGHAGDVITTDDGSCVTLTATRDFSCVIYSSPSFTPENSIHVLSSGGANEFSEEQDFSVRAENVYMKLAIREAQESVSESGVAPIGSVIVKDGQIVGQGHDQVMQSSDPTGHGAITAIRAAGQRLGTADLAGCELYTTVEPCAMCMYACRLAGIERIYYGCTREEAGLRGFTYEDGNTLPVERDSLGGKYLVCLDREACLAMLDARAEQLQSKG